MSEGEVPPLQPCSDAADSLKGAAECGISPTTGSCHSTNCSNNSTSSTASGSGSGGVGKSNNGSNRLSTGTSGRSQNGVRLHEPRCAPSPDKGLLRAFGRDRLTAVIKVGTSTLMDERSQTPSFSLSNIGKLVDTICLLRSKGVSVLLVTSGAVGAGCVSLHLQKRPEAVREKQALAAVGQCRLMRLYEDLFSVREVRVAQLLVSRNDFLRQRTYGNFRSCLRSLVDLNVVPILNENDSICTEELRFGDNDTLAAHCAVALEADFLFILTDVDCLYTKNPKLFTDARPVWFVDRFTDVYSYLSLQGGAWGTGGMYTKVVASKIATNLGVHVGIVNGAHPERVVDMLDFVAEHLIPASPFPHCSSAPPLLTRDAAAAPPPPPPAPVAEVESDTSGSSVADTPLYAPIPRGDSRLLPLEQLVIGHGPHPTPGVSFKQLPPSHPAFPLNLGEGNGKGGVGGSAGGPLVNVAELELPPSVGCPAPASAAPPATTGTLTSPIRSPIFEALGVKDSGTYRKDTSVGNDSPIFTCKGKVTPVEEHGTPPADLAKQFSEGGMTQGSGTSRTVPNAARASSSAPAAEATLSSVGCPRRAQRPTRMHQHHQQQHDHLHQHNNHEMWPRRTGIRFAIPDEAARQPSPPSFTGTIFVSQAPTGPSQSVRLVRRWILALPVRGEVYVDVGCARSLVLHRKSLFAAGVKAVRGTFVAGECLSIFLHGYQSASSVMGAEIGRCVSSFSSEELNIVKGHRSREFENLLGYAADQEVAHRHDLVLVYMNGDDRLQRICEGKESL